MTMFGLGLVHSPAGLEPIVQVQVHLYLDLDPDIWGLPGPGPDFGQSIYTNLFLLLLLLYNLYMVNINSPTCR